MSKGRHYRGPKKFVPFESWTPGASAPPPELATPFHQDERTEPMGLATIIEEVNGNTPPASAMPPHRASVLHLAQDGTPLNPRTVTPPAEPDAPTADVIVKGSRAVPVFDDAPEAEPEAAAVEATGEPDNEVEKVRLNAQRKISEQGAELAAYRKMVEDMLSATGKKPEPVQEVTPPVDVTALRAKLKEAAKGFLDDPEGTAEKMADLNAQIAQASITPILRQNEERAMVEATKTLVRQYPGLVTNKAEAAYVDAAAEMLAQEQGLRVPTLEQYETALNAYAKRVGWTKPNAGQTPNAEVEAMRREASSTAPVTASTPNKNKGKIWKRTELESLLTRHPEKYRELQPEILRAYREGRVK